MSFLLPSYTQSRASAHSRWKEPVRGCSGIGLGCLLGVELGVDPGTGSRPRHRRELAVGIIYLVRPRYPSGISRGSYKARLGHSFSLLPPWPNPRDAVDERGMDGHMYGEYWTRTGIHNFVMSQIMHIVLAPKIRFPMSIEKIYTVSSWFSNSLLVLLYTVMLKPTTVRTRRKAHFWLEGDLK